MSKIGAYVGLAQRSGSVLYGEDIICEKIHLAKVVLVSSSASDKYKERILRKISESDFSTESPEIWMLSMYSSQETVF